MYLPPNCINAKYLMQWARYVLRGKAGKFMIIWGREMAGNRTQDQVDHDCGCCGPYPFKVLRIYKDAGPDEKDEVIRVAYDDKLREFIICNMVNGEEINWMGSISTNNGQFVGQGLPIEMTGNEDVASIERDMTEATTQKDYYIPW
jgi:hypothetical protein